MAEQPLISVIVPVYNVGDVIGRCAESILRQTYHHFELLLVNDGSTDSSGVACDEYEMRDSRIRVFHQQNAGVSAARNVGLDNARGEYIAFIDGDDFVPTFYLERLMQGINGSAMAIGSSARVEGWSYSFDAVQEAFITIPVATCVERFLAGRFVVCVWGGLFRASVIDGLRFEEDLHNNEDKLFLYRYLLRCLDENLSFSNQKLYAYYVRPGSATDKPWNGDMDLVKVADKMLDTTREVMPEWNGLATANAIAARMSTMKWILTTTDPQSKISSTAFMSLRQEVLEMDTLCVTELRQRVELAALRLGQWAYRMLVGAYYRLVSTAARDRHNEVVTRQ